MIPILAKISSLLPMRLVFTLFSLLIYTSSQACDCGPLEKISVEQIQLSSVIFIGTVVSIEIDLESQILNATFSVSKKLKGEDADTIIVTTSSESDMCGLNFKTGQKWYIQTYPLDGLNWGTICERSALLKGNSEETKLDKNSMKAGKKRVRADKRFIQGLSEDVREKYLSNEE